MYQKENAEHPSSSRWDDTGRLRSLEACSHIIDGHSGQKNCLMTARPTPGHLHPPRPRHVTQQVDHGSVRLVLLRWTRDTDLHTIAMYADDARLACVGYDQQIDLDSVCGFSYRAAVHCWDGNAQDTPPGGYHPWTL